MSAVDLDQTDHKIIELLSQNARRTMADIGERVSLSASAVTRRIERLERSGVIAGYTVVVDHRKAGRPAGDKGDGDPTTRGAGRVHHGR